MEDSDDSEAKLREEIEAELDKISISSLENDEVENDSVSDTQSDSSDTDLLELPESVLHYINVIKNKSKTAEELILQDVEDTDIFSDYKKGCNHGTVTDSHMHLRTGSLPESKANAEQLMKILSVIEKEEFMRSLAPSARCVSVREIITPDTPMDEYILPDEADLSFGYFEVEERCRKSFEAWQDKQQELEEKDKETLEAQNEREKRTFQEEDEKRQCWMRQFEVEKKHLEDLQKQDQDKMNDELHKEEKIWKEKYRQHEEHIRNLHLKMEEERTRLSELQEKEKARLFKLRYDAAVKIQATYRASVTYRKYSPIIKEQMEKKRRRAQELKEKEAKIRQKEEEKRRRLEEEQRVEEEKKKKMLEERRRREREYEEKKSILRQEREEQRSKEVIRLREHAHSPLIITCALKKGDCHGKQQAIAHVPKGKGTIAKESVDSNSKKQEDACLAQQLNKRENTHVQQLAMKKSTGIKLKPNQAILVELKMNEKNESLPKLKINENLSKNQCSEQPSDQEFNAENVDQKNELENSNLKESVNEQYPWQGLESDTQTEEHVEHVREEKVGQETEKLFGFNQEVSAEDSKQAQGVMEETREGLAEEIEIKEMTQQGGPSDENNSSPISMQKSLPSLTPDNPEPVERSVTLEEDQETDLKSERIEEIPEEGVLSCDAAVINADASVHTEGEADLQDSASGKLAPSEEAGSHSANNLLATEEVEDSPKSEIQEALEKGQQTKAEADGVLTCSVSQLTVLSSVEERRLAWVKTFKPWAEIFEQNQHKKIVKKRRLVKCPPNTMPPLDPSAILQYGPWKSLKQVPVITFQGLPGCSLSTLAECSNLQILSLRRCGLTSLQGLSHCTRLKYIDAQENHIEAISCENLENLSVVLLNNNLLTSIHGFDGCTNLQSLELSHNKITRISGLESLKYLQELTVDHNQLISTKGLCEAPTIVYLDCSHNHLTGIDGIGNCGLLQIIKLQGNYLREPPSLRNHVLLRELHLDDNSISSVEGLSSCWLPLLQYLSISQNSLATIVPLFHLVSLEKLDVSNNCLSDLTNVMCWFNACYSLRELCLTGNPVLQEINWRDSILKTLPALRVLNGDMLNSYANDRIEEHYHQDLRCLLALCQYQLQEFNLLPEKYITQKRDILTLHAVDRLSQYYKDLMKLSHECRRAHEQGDVNTTERSAAETNKNHPDFSNTDSALQNKTLHAQTNSCEADSPATSPNPLDTVFRPSTSHCEELRGRNQEKLMAHKSEQSRISSRSNSRASFIEMKMADSPMSNHHNAERSSPTKAAMVIQAQWRSYIAHRQINCSAEMHPTTTEPLQDPLINNQTTSNEERRKTNMDIQEQREKAALHIQAVWKGFILRKKLATARKAIKDEESGEEYEEIDLEDFEFDEDALEKDWPALDSTGFPSQTLPLSNQLPWPKNSRTLRHDETSPTIPVRPAQAWLCNEKENVMSSEYTQLSSSRSESGILSWTPDSKTSRKNLLQSEKEEKISEEWGFKDISTAQQMLKRAKKMKSKKLRKKLEPSVRLALFKKAKNKVSVTKSSKKTQLRRDNYFEAHISSQDEEEEAVSKATAAKEKLERSQEYTYQWLHTQVGFPEATSSRNLKCNHFLPELDPDVLNGGRVQLVARLVSREDTDLDLFSMTSASALSVNKDKKSQTHRYSTGSSSCSSKGIIAPAITHTRPSIKERISFRDNPVRLSGSWGSGKKKAKFST
ncbi:leucine-rich repeat and IQ domain-containing protein 1 isoform X3 [Mus musculus]|uniref:leucine-rich repeat and IQ domain-containing protein 1 isoform X3 n=1 Tax=Mus musculus TaxID=10090 RepID=UPI0003D733BE|nr:leucine-rich repeat and IQ domain-containing protein 1 isoform X3 [Mus musculus]|eukprot:XP_006514319.1 PREDICTED: leucine-rich repeat and IQ domain-containing protein 1 isoform X3 [Mus musculus]